MKWTNWHPKKTIAEMINNKNVSIICFGFNPWSEMWKRVQQFMFRLSQEDFVEHVIFANPDIWTSDLRLHLNQRKKNNATNWIYEPIKEIEEVTDKITVWNPLRRVPKARSVKLLGMLESAMYERKIAKLVKERNMKNVLVWMNQLRDPELLNWIPNLTGFVFEWSDDWTAFQLYERNSDGAQKIDENAHLNYYLKSSLLNFTVTPDLHRRALEINPRSYHVPNATDYDNFSRAANGNHDIVIASDIAKYSKPIVGYVGNILNRIDFELVRTIAVRHPDWQFAFLGPQAGTLVLSDKILKQKNIVFLDAVPYKELPNLMAAMDVFTIPHKIDQATRGMSPIKLYDYLATGKPIVSTRVEGTENLNEMVYLADSVDEFEQQLLVALNEQNDSLVKKRQAYACQNSWQARIETVKDILKKNSIVKCCEHDCGLRSETSLARKKFLSHTDLSDQPKENASMNYEASMISKLRYGVPNRLRRILRSPFVPSQAERIVHCTYHKMGTKWFTSVLAAIADHYGLSIQCIDNNIDELDRTNDIVVFDHSDLASQSAQPVVGSRMIRDPRDVVVSGYFYHLWTEEQWARIPEERLGGRSYQQSLNSLSQRDGLHAEIDRRADYFIDRKIREWNFDDPRFLELKYENVFGNEQQAFRALFEHYGFTSQAVETSLQMAGRFSFDAVSRKRKANKAKSSKSHLRSGKSGQWTDLFTQEHKDHFKDVLGDVLVITGYEKNLDW